MLSVNFSPSNSESLIASSDLAARASVSGVSMSRVVIAIAEKQRQREHRFFSFRLASVICEIIHKRCDRTSSDGREPAKQPGEESNGSLRANNEQQSESRDHWRRVWR